MSLTRQSSAFPLDSAETGTRQNPRRGYPTGDVAAEALDRFAYLLAGWLQGTRHRARIRWSPNGHDHLPGWVCQSQTPLFRSWPGGSLIKVSFSISCLAGPDPRRRRSGAARFDDLPATPTRRSGRSSQHRGFAEMVVLAVRTDRRWRMRVRANVLSSLVCGKDEGEGARRRRVGFQCVSRRW